MGCVAGSARDIAKMRRVWIEPLRPLMRFRNLLKTAMAGVHCALMAVAFASGMRSVPWHVVHDMFFW